MRKEDRIHQQEQHPEGQQHKQTPPTPKEKERVSSSDPNEQPHKVPHEGGKLPLPE